MLAACVRWIGCGLIACVLGLPDLAAADDTWPADDAAYRERVRKALQEYRLGNWAEAKLYFSDAHELYPNARTLRGLGLVAYAQRDYVQAIGYLESALVNTIQPLSGELRAQIEPLLSQARRFVARVTVKLDPVDAELRVDERPPARTPDGSVWLNPGTHELVAMREGYESAMRRVVVEAGTAIELQLSLRARAESALPRPRELPPVQRRVEPAPVRAEPEEESSVAPYVVIGVSAALAATGGVLLGVALNDIGELERPPANTEWSAVDGTYRRTPALSGAGFALIGAGVVGAGAGLIWALWPEREREDVVVSVTPGGLMVRGSL